MKHLYRKFKINKEVAISDAFKIKVFVPRLFGGGGLFLKGENKEFKLWIVRFLFQIATHGKAKIFYIC